MKIKRITTLMIFLSFFLTSCGASTKWDTKINKGEEWASYQGYWQVSGEFSASELGYYYSEPGFSSGYKLTFFDKKTQKSSVVCNLPNCKHRDETCPAIFTQVFDMQYNNGYLFYVQKDKEQNSYLCRCAADGTNREQLFLLADFNETYRADPYIHKNHIFYVATQRNGIDRMLYHVDMNNPKNQNGIKEKILFAQGKNPNILIEDINDSSVLYTIRNDDLSEIKCYEYDYHTKETKLIGACNEIAYFRYVNDKVIYTSPDGTKLYSPDSETTITIFQTENGQVSYDRKYIYVGKPLGSEKTNEESGIDIYNTDGVLIDSILIPKANYAYFIYFGDKDYLLLLSEKRDKICLFDKKQIGTDTKEWLVR